MRTKGFYDIHSHILPGVDDGAQSVEEMAKMLEIAYKDGIRGIVLTPHVYPQRFDNTKATLADGYQIVLEYAQSFAEPIEVRLGAEVLAYSDAAENVHSGLVPAMGNSGYVLLEFPFGMDARSMVAYVREFTSLGYWTIVAHVERYPAVQKDHKLIDQLWDQGAYLQLNASSVCGENGFGVMWLCRKLIKKRMVHFIASDAHRADRRLPQLSVCYQKVYKWFGEKTAEEIFVDNPQKLFAGEPMDK